MTLEVSVICTSGTVPIEEENESDFFEAQGVGTSPGQPKYVTFIAADVTYHALRVTRELLIVVSVP